MSILRLVESRCLPRDDCFRKRLREYGLEPNAGDADPFSLPQSGIVARVFGFPVCVVSTLFGLLSIVCPTRTPRLEMIAEPAT